MNDPKRIKTLLVYLNYRDGVDRFYESYIGRLNSAGYEVEGYCLTLNPPGPRLPFSELDRRWKNNDKELMDLYKGLKDKTKDKDVLILFNGANLHPEFLKELNTYNVYMSFDDPESSETLSKPVAKHFDACLVGNIACQSLYKSWGCNNVKFRPLGYFESDVAEITEHDILKGEMTYDVSIFCERESSWRKKRLDYLVDKVPTLYARGRGWPEGYASDKERDKILSTTKIGLNLHNSIGPVNLRTYTLPAKGIFQICDNKLFLGHIFELGKEVIGYDEIEEVPDLINYYLRNDNLRRKIAVAGWERVTRDYNEIAVWNEQMIFINGLIS